MCVERKWTVETDPQCENADGVGEPAPVCALDAWNATAAPFPDDQTLHSLFFAQAARSPDALAIIDKQGELTYAELERRVTSLARTLADLGAGPSCLVGVCLDRSADMIAALLAVLATGAAYVALDPTYPPDRLDYMVTNSPLAVVISQRTVATALPAVAAPVIMLDDVDFSSATAVPAEQVSASNLAYVAFTSGSTGWPKGVEIRHRSVVNLIFAMQRLLDISGEDRMLAVANISFDMSVPELFLALLIGAAVVVVPREEAADGRLLLARWRASRASVIQATPVTWRMLIRAGWRSSPRAKLVCGGEALDPELARQLVARCGPFWNFYGPTETTVWSVAQKVSEVDGACVPIGRPLANTRLYILDDERRPVAIGSVGELYIGGIGVARGYLRHPDLTVERFFDDPVAGRMYRTGDLARFLPDGAVEFLGRADDQIKLRGFRIELGEIEAVLGQHSAVQHAVVIARPGSSDNRRLIAFIVRTSAELRPEDLEQFARAKLPDYMVPTRFVAIDTLPLTPNGKVDRRFLEGMTLERPEAAATYLPPSDAIEEKLVEIFEGLLNIRPIGIDDNFFALGGDSLEAVQLVALIQDGFPLCAEPITVNMLYEQGATVAHLAESLRNSTARPSGDPASELADRAGARAVEHLATTDTVDQAEAYFDDELLLIRNHKTAWVAAITKRRVPVGVSEVSDFEGFLATIARRVPGAKVIVALGDSTTANCSNWPRRLTAIPTFCRSGTIILNLADWSAFANSHVERLELMLDWLRRHGAGDLAVVFFGGFADGHASFKYYQEWLTHKRAEPFSPHDVRLALHKFGDELRRLNREPPAAGAEATDWIASRVLATLRLIEQICAAAHSAFVAVLQPLPYEDFAPGYYRALRRLYDDETHPGSFEIWRCERAHDETGTRPVFDALRSAWSEAKFKSRHGIYLDCSTLLKACDDDCFNVDGEHYSPMATHLIAEMIASHLPDAFKVRGPREPITECEDTGALAE
jgi:amino acid adenylation domain-containing protein